MLARVGSIAITVLASCAHARANDGGRVATPPAEPTPIAKAAPVDERPTVDAPVVDEADGPVAASGDEPGDIRPVESPPSDDRVARARQHFARGVQAFEVGDHSRALQEFTAADQLVPKAELRFNIARARQAMGDLQGARMELQALLARGDLGEAMREQLISAITAIERKLGAPGS